MEGMRKLWTLIGYELQHYCFSSFFYAICALFLYLMWVLFFVALKIYADFPQDEPLMMQFFKSMWLPLVLIVPILTTRAIVAEKNDRLFDLLLLLPVNNFSIVLSKFFVIYGVYAALWSMVIFFPEIAQWSVPSLGQFDHFAGISARFGSWFFVNLVGALGIAFGLFVSTHAKAPPTSMVVSAIGIFLFLVSGQIFRYISVAMPNQLGIFAALYDDWNIFFQLEDFYRGIFDTRVIIAYLTATLALLAITAVTLRDN
jgi:ABC-2 type transport system permease protein